VIVQLRCRYRSAKVSILLVIHGRDEIFPRLWQYLTTAVRRSYHSRGKVKIAAPFVSIRPRPYFSPSYNKVKSQTKHVWLLTLFIFLVYPFQLNGSKSA
ncbi:hypothetical protein, partial [Bacteroides sp.]|uniref:hypothetical protein n=1 Tax=Bacteroides sp. TaxID=29523 RepID=UPI003AAFB2BF